MNSIERFERIFHPGASLPCEVILLSGDGLRGIHGLGLTWEKAEKDAKFLSQFPEYWEFRQKFIFDRH